MNSDELERRLRAADPAQGWSADPAHGPRADALMEQIMNTPDTIPAVVQVETAPTAKRPRWPKFVLAGGAAAALAVGAFAIADNSGDGSTTAGPPATYELGPADITAMCLPVDQLVPPPGLIGFRGTVTEVGDGTVTLDVTKWYSQEGTASVVLKTTDLASVALDGVDFAVGGDYLVSVADGVVQICGFSGPYSPDYEAIFAGWFAA